MNIERMRDLGEVLDVLEESEELLSQLDMQRWRNETLCGTTYCWAGYYVKLFQEGPDAELALDDYSIVSTLLEMKDCFDGFEILRKHFDISPQAAGYLFGDRGYSPYYGSPRSKALLNEMRSRLNEVIDQESDTEPQHE
jgi:hypothetical protein